MKDEDIPDRVRQLLSVRPPHEIWAQLYLRIQPGLSASELKQLWKEARPVLTSSKVPRKVAALFLKRILRVACLTTDEEEALALLLHAQTLLKKHGEACRPMLEIPLPAGTESEEFARRCVAADNFSLNRPLEAGLKEKESTPMDAAVGLARLFLWELGLLSQHSALKVRKLARSISATKKKSTVGGRKFREGAVASADSVFLSVFSAGFECAASPHVEAE